MRDFQQLLIWQKSHALTIRIYLITRTFPKEEIYGLISQMCRSSSSIATNIAEGCGRNTNKEFKQFLVIASGSSSELQYQLILCKDLGYISENLYKELHELIIEVKKMIYSYSLKLI